MPRTMSVTPGNLSLNGTSFLTENHSTMDKPSEQRTWNVLLFCLTCAIALPALLGSIYSLVALLKLQNKSTVSMIVTSLAADDLISIVPLIIFMLLQWSSEALPQPVCTTSAFMYLFQGISSNLKGSLIVSYNFYTLNTTGTLSCSSSKRRVSVAWAILTIWILSLLMCVLPLCGWGRYIPTSWGCFADCASSYILLVLVVYSLCFSLLAVLAAPLTVQLLCSGEPQLLLTQHLQGSGGSISPGTPWGCGAAAPPLPLLDPGDNSPEPFQSSEAVFGKGVAESSAQSRSFTVGFAQKRFSLILALTKVLLWLPMMIQLAVQYMAGLQSPSCEALAFLLTALAAAVSPLFVLSQRWLHLPCGCLITCTSSSRPGAAQGAKTKRSGFEFNLSFQRGCGIYRISLESPAHDGKPSCQHSLPSSDCREPGSASGSRARGHGSWGTPAAAPGPCQGQQDSSPDPGLCQGQQDSSVDPGLCQGQQGSSTDPGLCQGQQDSSPDLGPCQGQQDSSPDLGPCQGQQDSSTDLGLCQGQQDSSTDPGPCQGQQDSSTDPGLCQGQQDSSPDPGPCQDQQDSSTDPGLCQGQQGSSTDPGLCQGQQGSSTDPGLCQDQQDSSTDPGLCQDQQDSSTDPGLCQGQQDSSTDPGLFQGQQDSSTDPGLFQGQQDSSPDPGLCQGQQDSSTDLGLCQGQQDSSTDPGLCQGQQDSSPDPGPCQDQQGSSPDPGLCQGQQDSSVDPGLCQGQQGSSTDPGPCQDQQDSSTDPGLCQGQQGSSTDPGPCQDQQDSSTDPGLCQDQQDSSTDPGPCQDQQGSSTDPGLCQGQQDSSTDPAEWRLSHQESRAPELSDWEWCRSKSERNPRQRAALAVPLRAFQGTVSLQAPTGKTLSLSTYEVSSEGRKITPVANKVEVYRSKSVGHQPSAGQPRGAFGDTSVRIHLEVLEICGAEEAADAVSIVSSISQSSAHARSASLRYSRKENRFVCCELGESASYSLLLPCHGPGGAFSISIPDTVEAHRRNSQQQPSARAGYQEEIQLLNKAYREREERGSS